MAAGKNGALSGQELEVLWLTAWGFTSIDIAARLGISAKTVTTYKDRACRKLNLAGRVAIVQHAKKNKWFEVDPLEVKTIATGK